MSNSGTTGRATGAGAAPKVGGRAGLGKMHTRGASNKLSTCASSPLVAWADAKNDGKGKAGPDATKMPGQMYSAAGRVGLPVTRRWPVLGTAGPKTHPCPLPGPVCGGPSRWNTAQHRPGSGQQDTTGRHTWTAWAESGAVRAPESRLLVKFSLYE